MAYVIGKLLTPFDQFRRNEIVQLIESYTDEKTKKKFHLVKSTLYEKGEVSVPAEKIRIIKINGHSYK